MSKFEHINIGDKAELNHRITREDIDKFVDLTGDDNKLHIDEEYARKTPFKKPVVHGMLGASFISTVIGTKLPGDGALWFSQSLEFLHPVREGDKITVKAEVIKKHKRGKIIELQTDIYNQNKEKVTSGFAKVKILDQEKKDEKAKRKIENRVALVVGATGGIGKAACLQLAKDGFDIIVHYHRNEKTAKEIKTQIEQLGRKAIIVKADIVDEVQIREMMGTIMRKFDAITSLVNCTTIEIAAVSFESTDWQDVQKHIDINVKGAYNLVKHVIPIMEREKYGKIVNITTQAIETPSARWMPYITAKSALNGFTKAIAVELAPKGIRVNMVSPGMTDTELISSMPEQVKLLIESRTPLKKLADPEDVANAISYLSGENSDFLTGETIRVNGGQVMI